MRALNRLKSGVELIFVAGVAIGMIFESFAQRSARRGTMRVVTEGSLTELLELLLDLQEIGVLGQVQVGVVILLGVCLGHRAGEGPSRRGA